MAMETDVSFLESSLDLTMDAAFPDLATHAGLIDPRPHPVFDQTLAGKPSPGTPSQFLLTPSSLWDRSAFDDAALDIFAEFPEDPEPSADEHLSLDSSTALQQVPEQVSNQVAEVIPEPTSFKEEPPVTASIPATRRLTRATSTSSQPTRNSLRQDKSTTVLSAEPSKVKKPRTASKKNSKKGKGQTKDKQTPHEDENGGSQEQYDEAAQAGDQPAGEVDARRNKFLERNRVAASKCRQKKKEWMHSLEERKNELEKTHNSLLETVNGLVAELSVMKEHLIMHAQCSDPNIDQWFTAEAKKIVSSKTGGDDLDERPVSSSGSGETHGSGRSSVSHFSPTSSIVPPTIPSPQIKEEAFSYDYMPDDMFTDDKM